LIHHEGFNACGVQDITSAANVPKGSFYSYFESKEAFAAEVVQDYWTSILGRHGPLLQDLAQLPVARVRNFFDALIGDHVSWDFSRGCLIGNLVLELAGTSESARFEMYRVLREWEAMLAECLHEAIEAGQISRDGSASDLAATLIEAWEGAVLRSKVERSGKACERFRDLVLPAMLA